METLYGSMQVRIQSISDCIKSGRRRLIDRWNARRALFFLAGVSDHLFSSSRFPCRAICLKSCDIRKKERVASLLEKPTDKWLHPWQPVAWSIECRTIYKNQKKRRKVDRKKLGLSFSSNTGNFKNVFGNIWRATSDSAGYYVSEIDEGACMRELVTIWPVWL